MFTYIENQMSNEQNYEYYAACGYRALNISAHVANLYSYTALRDGDDAIISL